MSDESQEPTKITFTEKEWEAFNNAREMLMSKQISGSLTEIQRITLEAMQAAAGEYVEGVVPLPMEQLSALEGQVRNIETGMRSKRPGGRRKR